MDLRIVKTKKAIREAFLGLRKKRPLERITVKEICDTALINKTTFYKYYQDIFTLSQELENEAVESFMECFKSKGCLFSDPKQFIADMPLALDSKREMIEPLFGNKLESLIDMIEKRLIEYYCRPGQSEREYILFSFVIGGTLHALKKLKYERVFKDETLAINVAEIINHLHTT